MITHLHADLCLKLYCRWERGGVPTGIFPGKYEWAGERGEGDCSLLVRDADREFDDGSWQCSVSPSSFQVSAGAGSCSCDPRPCRRGTPSSPT